MMQNVRQRESRGGFTLVEVMIVAGIVGMLAAISIPSVQKSRLTAQRQMCRTNLRLIEDAIEDVMMSSNFVSTSSLTASMVGAYLKVGTIDKLSWPREVTPPDDAIIQASGTNGVYVMVGGERVTTGR